MFIESDRLILKDYSLTDLDDYIILRACEDVWKYSTNSPTNDVNLVKTQLDELIESQSKYGVGLCALF